MAAIDVLVTAYNAEATLREALDSLLAQTFSDIRIVVLDDGSADATPQILADYDAKEDRVLVVTQPNGGIVDALNAGLSYCTAEYFARLDSDDVSLPERLGKQLAYLRSHPDCVAVGAEVLHIDANGVLLTDLPDLAPVESADAARAPGREPYLIHSTILVRRADMEAIGGYRHSPYSEDSDLFWRLAERGALFSLPEALCKYRVHGASISSTLVNGRIMAIGSQLSALSAWRRKRGLADLEFPRELTAELRHAGALDGMYELGARLINADERDHFRICVAAKIMEMARYRPYEPDAGDCAFIRAALPCGRHLSPKNQKELGWYVTVTAARLVRKGLFAEALALTPPASYPVAAARVLLSR